VPDDIADFLDLDPYPITIKGKTYEVPQPDWPTTILVADIMAGKKTHLTGKPIIELYKTVMGPVWDEMLADKVPQAGMAHAGGVVVAFVTQGRQIADLVLRGDVSPEALAAAKAANQTKKTPTTAVAPKTRSRASTSGTSTRPATPRSRAPKRPSA